MKGKVFLPFFLLILTVAVHTNSTAEGSSEGLQRFLQRYPEADLDGDGILSREEARAFRSKLWQSDTESGQSIPLEENTESRPVILGTPSYQGLLYGKEAGQSFDLWLPQGHPLPCPAVFFLKKTASDAFPALFFKNCLRQGWAVVAISLQRDVPAELLQESTENQEPTNLLDNLKTALHFFSEQSVAHGIRPDRIFLVAFDELAPYALYGNCFEANSERPETKINACALILSKNIQTDREIQESLAELLAENHSIENVNIFFAGSNFLEWLETLLADHFSSLSQHLLAEGIKDAQISELLISTFQKRIKESSAQKKKPDSSNSD